ncbi:MAG: DUF6622 family protein [Burkholderiaceae bacterium]
MFLIDIIKYTPLWVWGLLAALLVLGGSQARDREVGIARVTLLPLAMIALALYGVVGAFGAHPAPLTAWALGVAAALILGARLVAPRGARRLPTGARLHVRGSWLPLALIVSIFIVKYTVGVSLAMHPELARANGFDALASLAYGGFSGLFLARGLALWKVSRLEQNPQ